ncbi:MAG TPA: sugar transferase [Candidatus Polarisedimenticolia bacterium]|jgi:lipopolysaccharide/colanic/teichoic acid biosynthesis glycosyltransferase/dTDP-glucose pyrophosphorylase|nr:sugar transferase [Candidatus Polarisedimenticolia bacterium]
MKAVILAGGQNTHLVPMVQTVPKPLLPVANRPMVEYMLDLLRKNGVRDVVLAVNAAEDPYQDVLGDGRRFGLRLRYSYETLPRGTAGCLLPMADFIGREPFLVIHGSLFLDVDLKALAEFHQSRGALATLGVRRNPGGSRDWHHMELRLGEGARVEGIQIRNLSDRAQSSALPVGVYVFEPAVLSAIEPEVYYDIKEQLLPRLRQDGKPVFACELRGYSRDILEMKDYLSLNRSILRGEVNGYRFDGQIADRVWVGRGSDVSPRATLHGPVMIGRDCIIAPDAQIIGPACVGDGCVVEEGTIVRESLLLPGSRVEQNSSVEGCVLAADTVIAPGQTLREVVAIPESMDVGAIDLADTELLIQGVAGSAGQYAQSQFRYLLYQTFKRGFDLAVALVGLVVQLPLILAVALAIKFNSPGPVFFRQRRCGRNGREFWMVKFRTMVRDAERLQAELRPLNEVDGPVFKIENDPRSTALGRFLRKYSIDEVPQLWNVLKGEMSLVGPRPLAAREMRFCPAWRDVRLKVEPGITGLWQVSGRSKSSFHDWIRLDVEYVRERSVFLDFQILFKTLGVVVRALGSS